MRGEAPEASGGSTCSAAGMTPYIGLMTAERIAGVFACNTIRLSSAALPDVLLRTSLLVAA